MRRISAPSYHPAACLAYLTRVAFQHKGARLVGYVNKRNLNPHRKPGIGRVSYDVFVEVDGKPSGWLIRNVPAVGMEVL